VEDIGHMEEKLKEVGIELSSLRDREAIMRNQLEIENAWSKGQLQERENQLACMANFSFDEIQYRMPSKSYALYIKEKWL